MQDTSHPNLKFYRPSGAAPIGGILTTLIVGVVAAVPLAFLYAFINHHDPILYLNVLLVFGFGVAMGWLGQWGIRKFHIRNAGVALLLGLVIFAVGYVAHWCFYIATVLVDFSSGASFDFAKIFTFTGYLLQDPAEIFEMIGKFNENGVWTIGGRGSSSGMAVKGVLLAVVWVAEAIALLILAVSKPLEATKKPYSDRSSRWIEPTELPAAVHFVEDKERLLSALSRGDFSTLLTPYVVPQAVQGEKTLYATVTIYKDALAPCINVTNVTFTPKKKKEEVATDEVIRYLIVSPTVAQNLENALGTLPADPGPEASTDETDDTESGEGDAEA